MNYWNKICGLLMVFFLTSSLSYAQVTKKSLTELMIASKSLYLKSDVTSFKIRTTDFNVASLPILKGNYYTEHFGFMCKKELAFEKATKIPIRLRLGSLQECDRMEGKR